MEFVMTFAILLLMSYNGFQQKRRIDRLESDLAQLQIEVAAHETHIASLAGSFATSTSVVSVLAKRPSLSLDENGLVRGVEMPGPDGMTLTAFRLEREG